MTTRPATAEICMGTSDIQQDLAFFTKTLGFRLDRIIPADNPTVAALYGHGLRLRLDKAVGGHPGLIRITCDNPAEFAGGETVLQAPNGLRVEIIPPEPPLVQPETRHALVISRGDDPDAWGIGRAGMNYRDLIPDRLGGAIIASHIRIPGGGPVPDMVHYHTIGFQLIFCQKGWVDLLYEDQGPQFRLNAGDCVIQPPEIRHRVLFASEDEDLEVIEIGVPAVHVTTIDHEMELPNGPGNPDREFQGQKFVHHKKEEATWSPWRVPGFIHRDTGVSEATRGVANVQVAKPDGGNAPATSHNADILFSFLMTGAMTLECEGREPAKLRAGDSFVLPPRSKARYADCSSDTEILEVSLPGTFKTEAV